MTKYAIVTGGTKGIGKGISIELLRKGYYVIATYASDEQVATLAKDEFSSISNNFEILQVNQAKKDELYKFIDYIKENFESIDCIVCNAGSTVRKKMTEISDEDWETLLQVSVNSHFYLIRDLFKMIPQNSRIIFIGSLMGIHPHATSLPYGVSKAAVHALAKNLVKEFEGTGTTVNVIAPGFVETDWQKSKPKEIRENIYQKTAIKRFADISEVASACMFCIENSFVNGSIIEISGGYCFK